MRNFKIFICFAFIIGVFSSSAISSSSVDLWAKQFLVPDARILWSQAASFSECLTKGNDNQWHHCKDLERPLSEEYVSQRIEVEHRIRVPAAGKLYAVLEAHIDKDAWLYKHVKLLVYRYEESQGDWIDVNVRTYSALFKGQNLIYDMPEARKIKDGKIPVQYVQKRDGGIIISDQLPVYEPGDYMVSLRAADRGQNVYLPSEARAALYLIPEDPSVYPDTPSSPPSSTLPPQSPADEHPLPGPPTGIDASELTRIELKACSDFNEWCYNGGGKLTFDHGFIEIVPVNGCSIRLFMQNVTGTATKDASPPYRLQLFARSDLGGAEIGEPFMTDSAGSFNGIIGPCPGGNVYGFVVNSAGDDGSFQTYNTGARQQFATENYYQGSRIIWSDGMAQSKSSPKTGSLEGVWKMTCVSNGITYKYDLHLKQFGERFTGHMIRTNGREINTKVDGTLKPDGSIDFTRSTGGWRQHYVGEIIQVSGEDAIDLRGKFGDAGQEKFDWRAERFK